MTNPMLHTNDTANLPANATVLLVAIEMSLKTWRLAIGVRGLSRKRIKSVEGGDYAALHKEVQEAKERLQWPEDTVIVFCYEAGRDGFFPYRRLTEMGHRVWVIDSASIEVSRQKRRAQSDGIDVEKLLELMRRKAGGEQQALRIVPVPTVEEEDQRGVPREREVLLHDRQRVLNRIESFLFGQGYRELPKRAVTLRSWLEAHPELCPRLRERLLRECEVLSLLEKQLQELEQAMRRQVVEENKTEMARVAAALMGLCGIGLIGAWVLASELFGWRTFRNRREVGAALGLTPTPYSSGEEEPVGWVAAQRKPRDAGHSLGFVPQPSLRAGGIILALGALSARVGADALVQGAVRRPRPAAAADWDRGLGAAPGHCPVALPDPGRGAGGCHAQDDRGLNPDRSDGSSRPLAG